MKKKKNQSNYEHLELWFYESLSWAYPAVIEFSGGIFSNSESKKKTKLTSMLDKAAQIDKSQQQPSKYLFC